MEVSLGNCRVYQREIILLHVRERSEELHL